MLPLTQMHASDERLPLFSMNFRQSKFSHASTPRAVLTQIFFIRGEFRYSIGVVFVTHQFTLLQEQ
jgi:hypothetical protein